MIGGLIPVGTLAWIASDPVRKLVGLHQRRLSALLDSLERELTVFSHRGLKRVLATSPTDAPAGASLGE